MEGSYLDRKIEERGRVTGHTPDGTVLNDHAPMGGCMLPHTHSILEAWPVERKNALGDHIDRYHKHPVIDYEGG